MKKNSREVMEEAKLKIKKLLEFGKFFEPYSEARKRAAAAIKRLRKEFRQYQNEELLLDSEPSKQTDTK